MNEFNWQELAEKWPSAVIARSEVAKFSGGILNARTLANFDSAGNGPSGRFYIGRKTVYPVNELIAWMQNRVTPAKM